MFQIGTLTFDVTNIFLYFNEATPLSLAIDIFILFGWIGLAYVFLDWGLMLFVEEHKENKAKKEWKWVTLAIDVPMMNLQTPKAVEQLFSHLAGALDEPDIAAKYHKGHKQRWFSFEIISLEGYIQFVIQTEDKLRDLVEAALYAQYPDAEIIEIEDYTKEVPDIFPNKTHDMWAVDFGLAEDEVIPIRSYKEFEHNISKDDPLKDPMGTFLESFSRIGPGEQMWFQIIIQPINNSWKKKSIEKVQELLGKKITVRGNAAMDAVSNMPIAIVGMINEAIFGKSESDLEKGKVERDEDGVRISDLTPGQIKLIEAIEEKMMKIGFKTKLRGLYIATKDNFRPERGVQALVGAVSQYNIPSHNSIVPKFGISASYFGAEKKQEKNKNLLMEMYKKRKANIGKRIADPFIFNIEELATIWHFPMSHVKTPLLKKATDKKSEPPTGLPVEYGPNAALGENIETTVEQNSSTNKTGYDLDTGDGYDQNQKFG